MSSLEGPSGSEAQGAPSPDRGRDRAPRAVTYPYRRIERPAPTPAAGADPYGNDDPAWLRIDWRQHQRWLEVNGTTVNYVELGEGRPIVFVHGLGGCWQNWLENLPHFAEAGWRAIAMDLPGFGYSPMPRWEISMPAYGRLIDELCRKLNLHSTALVGNSMGGFISAEVALHSPSWIDHLVLVSAAGISHARMRREPVVAISRVLDALSPVAMRLNLAGLRRPGLRQTSFQGLIRHPNRVRPELIYELSSHAIGAPGFMPAVSSLTGYDFLDRLDSISVPTLLIWGRDDLVVPASDAVGYEQRIRDADLHVYDDCGHVPMAERPVRFNREVEAFCGRRAELASR